MNDPYFYAGTETLKNVLNEKDKDKLNEIEAEMTSFRIRKLMDEPIQGKYDIEHLFKIHQYIFQDLYEWAGKQRIINIEKSERALAGRSIEYADVFDIQREGISELSKMNKINWDSLNTEDKAIKLSECMAGIWKVHPFREGNTRTVVIFCCEFAESKGFPLDRKIFADNSSYVRTSLVAASAVFKDIGDKSNSEYLIKIVKDAIERGSIKKDKEIVGSDKKELVKSMNDWKKEIADKKNNRNNIKKVYSNNKKADREH